MAEGQINPVLPSSELLNPNQYLEEVTNNAYFDPENTQIHHPIISELITSHPLHYLFTHNPLEASIHAPIVYVQQLWHTLTVDENDEGEQILVGTIERFEFEFNQTRFRRMLKLPRPDTTYPNKQEYDPTPDDRQILTEFTELGYSGPLAKISHFRKKNIVPQWQTLYAIIMRCLTSVSKGVDEASVSAFKFLVGMAKHRHYDYSAILWRDLIKIVNDKRIPSRKKKFLPYPRFLTMIVQRVMMQNQDITRRNDEPAPKIFMMKKLYKFDPVPDVPVYVMPEDLIRLLPLDSPVVQDYLAKNEIVLMDLQEPADPAQGTPPGEDEGQSQSPVGETDREEQSDKNDERGGEEDEGDVSVGEGEADVAQTKTQSQSQETPDPDPIIEMNIDTMIVTPPAPKVILLEQRVETPKQAAATSPSYSHDFMFDFDEEETGDLYGNILDVAKESVDEVEKIKETESEWVRKEQESVERSPALKSREDEDELVNVFVEEIIEEENFEDAENDTSGVGFMAKFDEKDFETDSEHEEEEEEEEEEVKF